METYTGHVRSPADAVLLFEACRIGLLPRVQRRLSEKERQQIKSGSVFVWDEREAGMRRWTDGKSWSASRVSGSFLTYREMEGKRGGNLPTPTPQPKRPSGKSPDGSANGDSDDAEGPMDGYRYKPDGLMKQSFSITTQSGQHLHLISYYSRAHLASLPIPTTDAQLRHIRPPKNMYPESSVAENTQVPVVTQGPMGGSPYAPVPQQMGSRSPYPLPRQPSQVQVMMVPGPPTPPYQHHPYPIYVPQHSPHMYAAQWMYGAPPGYAPQAMNHLDRVPPHMANPHGPPGPYGYAGFQAPPHYPPPPPPQQQYVPHPSARAMQAAEVAQQQAQLSGQQHAHHQSVHNNTSIAEPGPILPAINGVGKAPTPQPSEPKSSESLNVPETAGAAQNNAPSPARTIPALHVLLNAHAADPIVESRGNQSTSRSGSRSPNNTQRPPREMIATAHGSAADASAKSKLDSAFNLVHKRADAVR